MASLREAGDAEAGEQDMEISFEPGLEDKARAALQAKSDRAKAEQMGVWEHYLEKRKQKRKQKKTQKKADDDDDVDEEIMNDPFFRDNADFGPEFDKPKGAKAMEVSTISQKDKKKGGKETDEERRQRAELELLLVGMWLEGGGQCQDRGGGVWLIVWREGGGGMYDSHLTSLSTAQTTRMRRWTSGTLT